MAKEKAVKSGFRGVFFSCLHYSETPPVMRKDEYGAQVLAKLEWVLAFAQDKDAHVVCCGDLFHAKSGVTYREMINMLSTLKAYGRPMYAIFGNHDIQGHNPNYGTRPIGVLIEAGVIQLLDDDGVELDGIELTGRNYCADYETTSPYAVGSADGRRHIHVTHGMLTNRKLPYDATFYKDLDISADLLINGHNHGYWADAEAGVYNVGSLARIPKEGNELNKVPKCLYVEMDAVRKMVKVIDVPFVEDVWHTEVRRDTLSAEEVQKFVTEIREMGVGGDTDALNDLLRKEEPEVQAMVRKYLGD